MCDPYLVAGAAGGNWLMNKNKASERNAREEQQARDDTIRDATWAREDKRMEKFGTDYNPTDLGGSKRYYQNGSKSGQSNTKNNQTYT